MFFCTPFVTGRGVKQGDIVSPTIFNIIVDVVPSLSERGFRETPVDVVTSLFGEGG